MSQQMKIKILSVEVGKGVSKANKPYEFLDVSFKNLSFDNKVEAKKVMPFGSKEVFNTLKAADTGDIFTLLREKDDAGYWQWVGIAAGDVELDTTDTKTDTTAAPATKGAPAKSTFETAEERAKKQIYIIRQSSLASAVALLKTDKKVPTVGEVTACAQSFVDFVLGNDVKVAAAPANDFDENEDIPF